MSSEGPSRRRADGAQQQQQQQQQQQRQQQQPWTDCGDERPEDAELGPGGGGSAPKRLRASGSKASWRANSKHRHLERVAGLLSRLPPPGGADPAAAYQPLLPAEHSHLGTDEYWAEMWGGRIPETCDPACGGRLCGEKQGRGRTVVQRDSLVELKPRAKKKRWQVATFALALRGLIGGWEKDAAATAKALTIVDFGCGSGNLVLPLATLYPHCRFIGIDMKAKAVELLQQRIAEAKLTNVKAVHRMIEHFDQPFDVALGLHACGNATDFILLSAVRNNAAYIVCPCCVGKLKFSTEGGSSFSTIYSTYRGLGSAEDQQHGKEMAEALFHPRSSWMRRALGEERAQEDFKDLARAADYSHQSHSSNPELDRVAKTNVEIDRNQACAEAGYKTALSRLLRGTELGEAKNDCLIGAPGSRSDLSWVWREAETADCRGG